jgi:hypothetical protein
MHHFVVGLFASFDDAKTSALERLTVRSFPVIAVDDENRTLLHYLLRSTCLGSPQPPCQPHRGGLTGDLNRDPRAMIVLPMSVTKA